VPVIFNEHTIGQIIIGDREDKFSVKEKEILNNISDYVAPVIHHIIKRKKDNQELQKEINEPLIAPIDYQLIFEKVPNIVMSIDKTGKILFCNDKIKNILGFDQEEVVGKPIFKLISSEHRNKAKEFIGLVKDYGFNFIDEYKMDRKDDSSIDVSLHISKLDEVDNRKRDSLIIIEDISDRKVLEKDLADACNRADVFLDLLSHDITNLNRIISSHSELLLKKPDLPEQYRKCFESTLDHSRDITDLVRNIRKLCRLKNNKFEKKNVDIFSELASAIDFIQKRFPNKKIEINQSIVQYEVLVESNEMLKDAFINLFSKLIRNSNENEVRFVIDQSLTDDGKYWKLEIKNVGNGIPDESKDKVFGSENNDNNRDSAELGLAVIKEVITKSNGMVWVQDRIEGDYTKGSNFIILLPKALAG
jgi:PAS domain S-box-containing protein